MKKNLTFRIRAGDAQPVYEQIRAQLRRHIARGGCKVGGRLPDLRTLAELAGVSLRTVQRAVDLLVQEGVCERRARRGIFVAPTTAATDVLDASATNVCVRPPQCRKVCCIHAPRGSGEFHLQDVPGMVYNGARERAAELGVDLLLLDTLEIDGYLGSDALEILGSIVVCWEDYPAGYAFARRYPQMPCVFTNYQDREFMHSDASVRGVFNDDYAGGYQIGNEFSRRGLRRVLILSMELPNCNYSARVSGCADAVAAGGGCVAQIIALKQPVSSGRPAAARNPVFAALQHCEPDAIFCVNDPLATVADEALALAGMLKKVELSGYDYLYPSLSEQGRFTTLKIDYAGMGRRAVDILADPGNYPKILRLAPQLLPCWRLSERVQKR